MSFLTVFLVRLGIGPLGPFLKESLQISHTQVTALSSAIGITYLPTLIVAGWLVDRLGVRRVLTFGTFFIGLCTVLLFFASSYQDMLIILVLSGAGSGCVFPATAKAIITWFSSKERATAMSINQTAVNAGGMFGGILLPPIAVTLGWKYGWLLMGLGTLVVSLICAILYRNPPREEVPGEADNVSGSAPKRSATAVMSELLSSRDIWMLFLAGFFMNIVEWGLMVNLALYLWEALFFTEIIAGRLLSLTEFAGLLGKPASGLISDRLLGGRRRIVFMLMAGATSVIALVIGLSGDNLQWLLYPIIFLFGMAAIGWGGLYTALAGEMAGKERADTIAGISAFTLVLGAFVGPPIFGFIVDTTGSYQAAWLAMALSSAIALGLMSLVREHRKRI